MPNRTIITALALLGVVVSGCEKEPNNDIAEPERREPMVEPGAAERTTPATGAAERTQPPAQQQQAGDLEVWPAVTIICVDIECAATDVYFPTESAELDAADKAALDGLAACLKGTPQKEKVEITATTDPRGPEKYNEQLARQRAQAVDDYLQQQGVKPGSFEIRARGEQGVVEGVPMLWPLQREAVAVPKQPEDEPGA